MKAVEGTEWEGTDILCCCTLEGTLGDETLTEQSFLLGLQVQFRPGPAMWLLGVWWPLHEPLRQLKLLSPGSFQGFWNYLHRLSQIQAVRS